MGETERELGKHSDGAEYADQAVGLSYFKEVSVEEGSPSCGDVGVDEQRGLIGVVKDGQ